MVFLVFLRVPWHSLYRSAVNASWLRTWPDGAALSIGALSLPLLGTYLPCCSRSSRQAGDPGGAGTSFCARSAAASAAPGASDASSRPEADGTGTAVGGTVANETRTAMGGMVADRTGTAVDGTVASFRAAARMWTAAVS